MHTYLKSRNEELWTVGFFNPGVGALGHVQWEPLKDFSTEEKAAKYVNYLNGGNSSIDANCYVMEP